MYASTGIISATKFYGDGSNLLNTGATLNSASGTQRLVLTSLTSGTMVNAATDSDLAYNASDDRLIVSNIDISGITTLGGPVTAGSSEGVTGQYLRHVGTGVTWASFPTLRVTRTDTATAGQTTFNFNYNVDFLDVFVNGVKLTSSEYSANNGSQIVLNTPAFAGEIVEFHSYNVASTYGAGGGGGASNLTGLSDVNFPIALADDQLLQFNSSTNVWENVNLSSTGVVTSIITNTSDIVSLSDSNGVYTIDVAVGAGGTWATDLVGINTIKNVGIGTTAKDGYKLYVEGDARITGILTVGPASVTIDGINNSINCTTVSAGGSVTANQFYGDGSNLTGIVTTNLGKANVTISDNPPGIGTAHGDLWWESDTAKGYIYYNDGSSAQWVEFGSGAGGGGGSSYANSDVDTHLNTGTASSGEVLSWNGSDYDWVAISTNSYQNSNVDTHLNTSSASSGQILSWNGSDYAWVADQTGGGGSGITTAIINADTLNVSGVSTFNGDVLIEGTDKLHFYSSTGQEGQIYATSEYLYINSSATNGAFVQSTGFWTLRNGSNGNNWIVANSHPNHNGEVSLYYDDNKKLETLGAGVTITGTTFSNQLSVSGVATATSFVKSGGTSSQYLMADGSTTTASGGSGIGNVVEDTTPQLGGDLDLNSNNISGSGTISATKIITSKWTLGANGSSDYTFTGPGLTGTVNDPTIYLIRGQSYQFVNNSGGHPFRIQSTPNGSTGTQYNTGVTNNDANNGVTLTFDVPFDAPDVLYYQCTAHPNMGGKIVITAPPKRFTTSASTGSIAAAATQDITIAGCETYALLKIQTSHAAWVRLYTDTTSRTNDASRAYTTDPTPGSGVLAEVYTTTSGSNTFKMTPGVIGWNDDGTPSSNIYAKVTNNESGSADVTVTLTIVRMED